MTTADELLLLAIVPGRRRSRIRSEARLGFALRAAELADLSEAGRIAVGPRRIEVLDPRRLEDRRLNNVLHILSRPSSSYTLKEWLRRTPRSLTVEYLSRLEDQKVVRVRRRRDPHGRTRHEILSVDLRRRAALVGRVDAVVGPGAAPSADPHALTLAVLVATAGLAPALHPGLRGVRGRRRITAFTAAGRLAGAADPAVPIDLVTAADGELAAALIAGGEAFSRRISGELSDIYSDVTTGGHGLGHDLASGGWSDGGGGGSGHHGGGAGHGGGHGDW